MKNLKINDKKIKNVLKRGFALTTIVFTLATLSGCSKKPDNWPNEFTYINQEDNSFEEYNSTVIRNGKATTVYKAENISLAINKETYEVKEYIYHNGILGVEIYDLNTGYLVADATILSTPADPSISNAEFIFNNHYIVDFVDINNYLEEHNLQNDYTLDEIRELEPSIVEAVKKINEYESNKQKIK